MVLKSADAVKKPIKGKIAADIMLVIVPKRLAISLGLNSQRSSACRFTGASVLPSTSCKAWHSSSTAPLMTN